MRIKRKITALYLGEGIIRYTVENKFRWWQRWHYMMNGNYPRLFSAEELQLLGIKLDIGYIEAIPLTAEILEKNGFEYNDSPIVLGWEQYGLTLYRGGDGFLINCGQNVALIINYVYELQFVLRLCRIDKEIVL